MPYSSSLCLVATALITLRERPFIAGKLSVATDTKLNDVLSVLTVFLC
jgi:hypothetical protein